MRKVFSGLDEIPRRIADDTLVPGCVVLEGGAFRAVYGEGVLDRMMEEGITMGCTIGVSAGALNGFNYVGGNIGRAARINLSSRHDSRYVGMRALRENKGIIGFEYAFGYYEENVESFNYERFYKEDRRFVAVCTNVGTGDAEFFEKGRCTDIFQAIRGSASMPYLSKPVNVDGIPCLDGGCRVKIPYRWAMDQGYDKIVVIRTRPRGNRRNESGAEAKCAKVFYGRYPEFAETLETSPMRANSEAAELEDLTDSGRIFTVFPSRDLGVGRIEGDMEKLGEWYYLGYNDMDAGMDSLKEYLGIAS